MLAYLRRLAVSRRFVPALVVLCIATLTAVSAYSVEPGDTLSQIASDHGVSTGDLAKANGISDPNKLWVGQVLEIPGASSTAAVYVVQPGETLGAIAAKFNTTVAAISELNGITNPNLVYAGTRLQVSGEAPSASTSGPVVGTSSSHTVAAGETLSQIATQYGMSTADLAAANSIENPNRILVGQKLTISGKAGFICPVPGGTFFNDWGFPRSGGRYHEGNDLFAARGTPILAPTAGFVHHLEGALGGLQFRLDGDDGHRYIGSHMDSFGKSGQVVAGEVIGYIGDSGNALGSSPHVHFEIALGRTETVNPFPYLDAACNS